MYDQDLGVRDRCALDANTAATAPALLLARPEAYAKTVDSASRPPGDFEVQAKDIHERVTMCTYAHSSCTIVAQLTDALTKINTTIQATVWRTTRNAYLVPPELTLALAVSPSVGVLLQVRQKTSYRWQETNRPEGSAWTNTCGRLGRLGSDGCSVPSGA